MGCDTTNGQDWLRKQLSDANNIVAKAVGKQYSVYRATSIQNVLDAANFQGKQYASFALALNLSNVSQEPFQQYYCYVDMNAVRPGDVLNDGCDTYVITWNHGIDKVMAIKAEFMVEVWRSTWATTGGLASTSARYAKNVPASFSSTRSVTDFTLPQVRNAAQAPTWDVRIWTAAEEIQPSDMIIRVEDGLQLQLITIQNNKHNQILTCRSVQRHGS
jgi:hypothetical protein